MGIRGFGAALAAAARRGLYEVEESRPGRSDLAYMQHKYSPLDSRIIIITAAILVLLIAILFLNFFIRWVLHHFFLFQSPKPMTLNKGLSKPQVQALPSFIYSSSKPLPTHLHSAPCRHVTFYPPFVSHPLISSQIFHVLFPTSMTSTKVGNTTYQHPTKLEGSNVDYNPPSQLVAIQVHKVIKDDPNNQNDRVERDQPNDPIGSTSLEVSHALGINLTTTIQEEVVDNARCNEGIVHRGDKEVNGSAIIDCNKSGKVDKLLDDKSSSDSPCPICLLDFSDGETIRMLPACRHYFHIGCIDLWLAKSSSCPACRSNLLDATKAMTKKSTLHVALPIAMSQ